MIGEKQSAIYGRRASRPKKIDSMPPCERSDRPVPRRGFLSRFSQPRQAMVSRVMKRIGISVFVAAFTGILALPEGMAETARTGNAAQATQLGKESEMVLAARNLFRKHVKPDSSPPSKSTSSKKRGYSKPKPRPKTTTSRESAPDPTKFRGEIGDGSIDLNLVISGSTASGSFQFLQKSDEVYLVKGKRKGTSLDLKIFRVEALVATARLTTNTKLQSTEEWKGTLQLTDGTELPIWVNRPKVAVTPKALPVDAKAFEPNPVLNKELRRYEGMVGDRPSVFLLQIHNGLVQGSYYQTRDPKLILRIDGENPKGKLILREYDSDGLSAEFHLTLDDKSDPKRICWVGHLQNLYGQRERKEVHICREK